MSGRKAFEGIGLLVVGLVAACLTQAAPVQAAAGINQQLTFQGKVVNSSGVNLADGTYDMEFKIYQDGNSSGTGSTLMWTEDYLVSGSTGMPSTGGVSVSSGTFNVNLGSICALAGSTCGAKTNTGVDFNQDTLWLSFQVGNTSSCTVTSSTTSFHTGCGGDGEMTPFIRLTAVPQALNANRVGGLTVSQLVQLSPGSQQSGSINVSGNIQSGGTVHANTLDAATSGALSLGGGTATGITLLNNLTGGSSITATLAGVNALTLGSTTATGGIVFQDGTSNNRTVTLTMPGLANSYSLSWATSGATGTQCLQSTSASTSTVTGLQWGSCGGGISLGAVDSAGSANANGATLTGSVLNLNSADGTHPGVINASPQTIGGAKTFSALITGSAGISVSGGAITLQGNAASTLTTSSGNLTLDATSGSTPSILIGNGAQNKAITAGNTQSSTTITLQAGATTETISNSGDTVQNTAAAGSATAFQVQNANSEPVLLVDTTNSNLLTNPGFETGVSGWSGSGTGASCVQNTATVSRVYYGLASLKCTTATSGNTTATVNSFTSTLSAGTYTFSFYAMSDSSITLASTVSFTGGGGTCSLSSTSISNTGFQRYSCTVTTTGTTTSIVITTSTLNATLYVDAVMLASGSVLQPYDIGAIQLRGTVTNPAFFEASSNSNAAFQVQNSSASSLLSVDTTTNNLIPNSDFETGISSWSATGNATIASTSRTFSTSEVYEGTGSMAITLGTTTPGATVALGTTLPTGTYAFSFFATASVASVTLVSPTIGGATCTLNSTSWVSGSGWQRYTCTVTATSTFNSVTISSTTTSGTLWIDAVQLTSGGSVGPYNPAAIQLRGIISSPLVIHTSSDEGAILQVWDWQGLNMIFSADNHKKAVQIGSQTSDANQVVLGLDSYNTYTDASSSCSTTLNNGALYYNTVTNSIRACINDTINSVGNWEDLVSTAGLGMIMFGVVPDSGANSNAGDVAGVAGSDTSKGPCRVYMGSVANSIRWTGCTLYAYGRKEIINAQTTDYTTGITTTGSVFQNLCVFTAGNQPTFGTASITETSASVPGTWSPGSPSICLATIKEISGGSGIGIIYDTRPFTTSTKIPVVVATATAIGQALKLNGTIGEVAPTSATTSPFFGVLVSWNGFTSTNTITGFAAVAGPVYVQATAGSVGAYVKPTATAGFVNTSALVTLAQTDIPYTYLGLAQSPFNAPGTQCSTTANADTCRGSILVDINIR